MRQLIAGMKISVDGKIEGPDGTADWVDAWSEDYGVQPRIDACLLGGGMYPGYENYWSGIQNEPDKPAWITGAPPTPSEREWARFIAQTPHHVLSSTLTSAAWKHTSFVRDLAGVAELKQRPGRDIYVVGGARTTASLIEAGLIDELRLHVYPLIAGPGKELFATTRQRRAMRLVESNTLAGGRVSLVYRFD